MITSILALAILCQPGPSHAPFLIPDTHYKPKTGDQIVTYGPKVVAVRSQTDVPLVYESIDALDYEKTIEYIAKKRAILLDGNLSIKVLGVFKFQKDDQILEYIKARILEDVHIGSIVFLLKFHYAKMIGIPKIGSTVSMIAPQNGPVTLLWDLESFETFIDARDKASPERFDQVVSELKEVRHIKSVVSHCHVKIIDIKLDDKPITKSNIIKIPVRVEFIAKKYRKQQAWVTLDVISTKR
jgi:hypothetical protein